jgi:hypothetical protein
MENASKALIFAASVLIAVLLFVFMFYMFQTFGGIASDTEATMATSVVASFNNKLDIYQTEDVLNIDDASKGNTKQVKITDLFRASTSVATKSYYNEALVMASQNLNTASDVLSAVNFAISNNNDNNNGYVYENSFEKVNTVEIIIDLYGGTGNASSSDVSSFSSKKYLLIEPNAKIKANYAFATDTVTTTNTNNYKNKEANITLMKNNYAVTSSSQNRVSLYKMLNALRNTKLVEYNGQSYTVYKYYFLGNCILNSNTGKIETIKFTLMKDYNF